MPFYKDFLPRKYTSEELVQIELNISIDQANSYTHKINKLKNGTLAEKFEALSDCTSSLKSFIDNQITNVKLYGNPMAAHRYLNFDISFKDESKLSNIKAIRLQNKSVYYLINLSKI